ncbi:MAG: hypothetical protein O7G83_09025 [Proteobacteria bacterium]|nr:hypothetical protein [Pseudomonadota bacterium]
MRPLLSNHILSCRRSRIIFPIGIAAGFLLLAGCQRVMTLGMNSHRHGPIAEYHDSDSPLLLAAYPVEPSDAPPTTSSQPTSASRNVVNEPATKPTTKPTTKPADKAPKRPRYTLPGDRYRQAAYLSRIASLGTVEPGDPRRNVEAAENSLGRPELQGSLQSSLQTQSVGQPGMGAVFIGMSQPIVLSVGKAGLQQGSPLSDGLLMNNIFQPSSSPLSARCQELVTAGFFADIAGCQNHFGP